MGSLNTASFPIGQKILVADEAYAKYQEQLGAEVVQGSGPDQKRYRLVQAASADGTTGRSKGYTWATYASSTVDIGTAGDVPCGVGHPTQVSLAAGDLFWLQIGGPATVTADGTGHSAGDSVKLAATGDTDTAANTDVYGDLLGTIPVAIAGDATGICILRGGL